MTIKISGDQYAAFFLGLTGALPILPTKLRWLGCGKAYADPLVIEVAIKDTPVRLSFKFKAGLPLRCCINLRPYSDKFGKEKTKCDSAFKEWVSNNYAATVKASDPAPYFKPYGKPPSGKQGKNAKTQDTYFELGCENISLTNLTQVYSCPEFPHLKKPVQLTLVEAVSRILQRLRKCNIQC